VGQRQERGRRQEEPGDFGIGRHHQTDRQTGHQADREVERIGADLQKDDHEDRHQESRRRDAAGGVQGIQGFSHQEPSQPAASRAETDSPRFSNNKEGADDPVGSFR
jgi:hypothetical protein